MEDPTESQIESIVTSHQTMTLFRSSMTLGELVKFCRTNKTILARCKASNFWESWFKEHGVPLPEGFIGLDFKQVIDKIWQGLLNCDQQLYPTFYKFLDDPKFLFPGIERFVGFVNAMYSAVQLNDDPMIDYLVAQINSLPSVRYFDYLTIRILIELDRPDILTRIMGYKFTNLPNKFNHYIYMVIAQTLGIHGNSVMYNLITARFFRLDTIYIFCTQVFAYFADNITFANELFTVDPVLSTVSAVNLANDLRWLASGAQGTINPISNLQILLYSYFIGMNGLFTSLDRIMTHNLTSPQNKVDLYYGHIISMAMNYNNYDFLEKIFNASWYNPQAWLYGLNTYRLPIIFANSNMWELLFSSPQIKDISRSALPNLFNMMSDVTIGNRIDIVCYLESIFGRQLYIVNDYIGTELLDKHIQMR